MVKRPVKSKVESLEPAEHRGVVVGWTHHDLGSSIDLRIQSTVSRAALDATGQSLPQKRKPSLWRRLTGSRNK